MNSAVEPNCRTALVVGGSRGIGLATARALARKGIQVIIGSRDQAVGENAISGLAKEGLTTFWVPIDVQLSTSIICAKEVIVGQFGPVEILVNCAGVYLDQGMPLATPIDTIEQSINVNTFGAIRLCQAFVPEMKEKGFGRIVNITSGMASAKSPNLSGLSYRISKAALNVYTRCLATELRTFNIAVNALCPTQTRTRLTQYRGNCKAEDIGGEVVYLATLVDSSITGGVWYRGKSIAW